MLRAYHTSIPTDIPTKEDSHHRRRYNFNDVTTKVNELLSENVRDFQLDGENEEKALVQVSEVRSSLCVNLYFYPNQSNYEEYMNSTR